MGSLAKIIVVAIVCGVVQQIVESVSDSYRPSPKVEEPE